MPLTAHLAGQEPFGAFTLVRFHNPTLAQRLRPGHFLLVRLQLGWDPYLRVPFFPATIGHTSWLAPLPQDRPQLARVLAQAPPGTPIGVWGPFGTPFPDPIPQTNVLVVTQEPYLPLVLGLLQRLTSQTNGVLLVERTGNLLPDSLTWLSPAVEFQAVPADGQALESALASLIPWADHLYAAGPRHWPRFLAYQIERLRLVLTPGWAYALVPEGMTCGLGMCDACLVDTPHGWMRTCRRGPVLDLGEWFGTPPRGR